MVRVKLVVSYNGKNFSGYQIQPNKRTVQEEIEKVLEFLLKEKIRIYASGRTDAGVSALGQVIHFDTNAVINEKKLQDSMNALLPSDICAISVSIVDLDFDARFSVKKKTYRYNFYVSKYTHPIFDEFATRINDYANIELMQEACKYLIGSHDFESFVSKKSGKSDFVRTIYDAKIVDIDEVIYAFEITGNGFLYNMVRIIAGTLVEVGLKHFPPEEMKNILDAKDRQKAGKTLPPTGLFLMNVEY